jgi:hypothetical protein
MTRRSGRWPVAPLGLALATAMSAPLSFASVSASSCPVLEMELSDGARLTAIVRGAPLHCVLAEVASLVGMEVRGGVDDASVSSDLVEVPLTAALSRLLGSRSYFLQLEGDRPLRLTFLGSIHPPGNAPAGRPSTSEVGPALRHALLEDPDLGSRRTALDLLEAMPRLPAELVASVAEQDFDPSMRRRALDLLAARAGGDPAGRVAAEVLVRNDPDPTVREAAAAVLRAHVATPPNRQSASAQSAP